MANASCPGRHQPLPHLGGAPNSKPGADSNPGGGDERDGVPKINLHQKATGIHSMKNLFCVAFATIFAMASALAEALDNRLPAAGTTVALKPTTTGYEVPPEAGFSDVKVKSSDATLDAVLDQSVT
jgi:hypothetical protein